MFLKPQRAASTSQSGSERRGGGGAGAGRGRGPGQRMRALGYYGNALTLSVGGAVGGGSGGGAELESAAEMVRSRVWRRTSDGGLVFPQLDWGSNLRKWASGRQKLGLGSGRPRSGDDTPGRGKGSPEGGPKEKLGVGSIAIGNVIRC